MNTKQQMERNVRSAISRMKNNGTTGASFDCLRQNTETTGLTCSVAEYFIEFRTAAPTIAKRMKFNLYE